ncbi:hypothetical protein [Kineosporia succinea]|uniref:Uncharacterized protein n=1 Tax=Kineosporia succinea TaxID=84632 RepID=A0ABT9P0K1_9ACTN|nr:hypothetical protein [Kineosporia succinea]MDP9825620.1 hypothetical protein [Kineosporia succinea]
MTENGSVGTPTISVATMSAISIDLEQRIATLPRQVRPGAAPLEPAQS